jgi:hypothetical protein
LAINFAVVLRNPDVRPSAEIFKTEPIASRRFLKYGLMISSLPVSFRKKETSMQRGYRDIRKEGILI